MFCWMQQVPAVKGKLEARLHSVSIAGLKDVPVRACRPEKRRLWMNLLGLADKSQ
jgi:protein prenyltransferase alpha subunit repeat containing protein 1